MNKLGFEVNHEDCSVEINRCHPFIWLVFLMDLVFGPLLILFCKEYTFKQYINELKGIIKGRYERL